VRKIIAQSHAAQDIRPVVQKLNRARDVGRDNRQEESEDGDSTSSNEGARLSDEQQAHELPSTSRWSRYERQERSAPRMDPASLDTEGAREEPEDVVPSYIPCTVENRNTLNVEPSRDPLKPKPGIAIQASLAPADLHESKAAASDILAEVDDDEWS